MSAWQTLMAASWLWPFMLLGMGLTGLLTASLVWASGPAARQGRGAAPDTAGPACSGSGPGRSGPAVWLITLAAPLLVVALYAALGNPRAINPQARQPGGAMQTLVDKLAQRLQANPDDAAGWLMLARSYKALGRYQAAADAWEHTQPQSWNDVDSLAEWVEARILAQGQHFDQRSQQLLARAMSLNPEHPGVLLLRGLSALDRGDLPAAQNAFTTLRAQYPGDSPDRQALDQALAHIATGRNPLARNGNSAPPDTPPAPGQPQEPGQPNAGPQTLQAPPNPAPTPAPQTPPRSGPPSKAALAVPASGPQALVAPLPQAPAMPAAQSQGTSPVAPGQPTPGMPGLQAAPHPAAAPAPSTQAMPATPAPQAQTSPDALPPLPSAQQTPAHPGPRGTVAPSSRPTAARRGAQTPAPGRPDPRGTAAATAIARGASA